MTKQENIAKLTCLKLEDQRVNNDTESTNNYSTAFGYEMTSGS